MPNLTLKPCEWWQCLTKTTWMTANSVPTVSAVSSPKEARRVWCGRGSRTIISLLCTCTHPPQTAHPTHYSRAPELEGEGHKDTLHSAGQQRKIISLFVCSCMCVCTNARMYTFVCVCLCVRTLIEHPTHSPAWPAPGSRWMYWSSGGWGPPLLCRPTHLQGTPYKVTSTALTGCEHTVQAIRKWWIAARIIVLAWVHTRTTCIHTCAHTHTHICTFSGYS